MAVSKDTAFELGDTAKASPMLTSGTVAANSNRVLIIMVGSNVDMDLAGSFTVTWAAQTATLIQKANQGVSFVWLYGIIAPTTGTNNLSITWTDTLLKNLALGAVSLFDADQTTGWQNNSVDVGNGTSASSVVTTANGNAAVAGHCNNNGTGTSLTAGTQDWLDTSLDNNFGQAHVLSTGGTATMTWTWTGAKDFANAKVDVIAFGAQTTVLDEDFEWFSIVQPA